MGFVLVSIEVQPDLLGPLVLSLNQLGVDPLKEWVSSRFVTTLMSTILKNNFLWLTRILILNYYNLN
jgi:hypothetical protein